MARGVILANRENELARLQPWAEKARRFTGWDLSSVEPKQIDQGPTWNYEEILREHLPGKKTALDMGTGGGELLSTFRSRLPALTIATEEWSVNAPIANQRLGPIGISFVRCKSLKLPFASLSFDLVINRHEELDPLEIGRVLRPSGHIVTQQVGDNWPELRHFFPRMPESSNLFQEYIDGFEKAGLRILQKMQCYYRVAYKSLGEVVFMLGIAPWEIPEFSVERDLDALLSLESEQQQTGEGLVLTESRFLIIAQK